MKKNETEIVDRRFYKFRKKKIKIMEENENS